ncbi:uncharacterized protein MKK02DRAFT_28057 [Dioszegia hungarica]|uniref:Uncharacterized protein n=1 Tax=Dioszegia hungarica TaxID=4972 RepID=A0AA38H6B8_9TREE|nr:uncharacterized protein MKK02DRAFT_28057 [Dioszegia hungarica]KAI9634945.1 hypothetical protein MKK02DRAFT_28057 [Dioszegia hungarica]
MSMDTSLARDYIDGTAGIISIPAEFLDNVRAMLRGDVEAAEAAAGGIGKLVPWFQVSDRGSMKQLATLRQGRRVRGAVQSLSMPSAAERKRDQVHSTLHVEIYNSASAFQLMLAVHPSVVLCVTTEVSALRPKDTASLGSAPDQNSARGSITFWMKDPRPHEGDGDSFDVSHEITEHRKGFRVILTNEMIGEVRGRMRLQGFDADSTEAVVNTLSGKQEAGGVYSMDVRRFGGGLIESNPGRYRSSVDFRNLAEGLHGARNNVYSSVSMNAYLPIAGTVLKRTSPAVSWEPTCTVTAPSAAASNATDLATDDAEPSRHRVVP